VVPVNTDPVSAAPGAEEEYVEIGGPADNETTNATIAGEGDNVSVKTQEHETANLLKAIIEASANVSTPEGVAELTKLVEEAKVKGKQMLPNLQQSMNTSNPSDLEAEASASQKFEASLDNLAADPANVGAAAQAALQAGKEMAQAADKVDGLDSAEAASGELQSAAAGDNVTVNLGEPLPEGVIPDINFAPGGAGSAGGLNSSGDAATATGAAQFINMKAGAEAVVPSGSGSAFGVNFGGAGGLNASGDTATAPASQELKALQAGSVGNSTAGAAGAAGPAYMPPIDIIANLDSAFLNGSSPTKKGDKKGSSKDKKDKKA